MKRDKQAEKRPPALSGRLLTWDPFEAHHFDGPACEDLKLGIVERFHPQGPLDGIVGERPDELCAGMRGSVRDGEVNPDDSDLKNDVAHREGAHRSDRPCRCSADAVGCVNAGALICDFPGADSETDFLTSVRCYPNCTLLRWVPMPEKA